MEANVSVAVPISSHTLLMRLREEVPIIPKYSTNQPCANRNVKKEERERENQPPWPSSTRIMIMIKDGE